MYFINTLYVYLQIYTDMYVRKYVCISVVLFLLYIVMSGVKTLISVPTSTEENIRYKETETFVEPTSRNGPPSWVWK